MGKYFDRFPLVNYDGAPVKNILTKVDFTDEAMRNIHSNFDMTIQEGLERPDVLSYNYYNSSFYDWMIYLSNQVIDPYYDVYRSQDDFYNFIVKKYGSTEIARNKILFYRNSWATDDRVASPAYYEALVTDETKDLKKYWKPKLNNLGAIIGYERSREDWIVSTNRILEVTLSADLTNFKVDDLLYQSSASAYGNIVAIDNVNHVLTVQHIRNANFEVNESDGITDVKVIQQVISNEESEYWSPVFAYDYEEELNESKKHITMIKSSYLPEVEKMFLEKIK